MHSVSHVTKYVSISVKKEKQMKTPKIKKVNMYYSNFINPEQSIAHIIDVTTYALRDVQLTGNPGDLFVFIGKFQTW